MVKQQLRIVVLVLSVCVALGSMLVALSPAHAVARNASAAPTQDPSGGEDDDDDDDEDDDDEAGETAKKKRRRVAPPIDNMSVPTTLVATDLKLVSDSIENAQRLLMSTAKVSVDKVLRDLTKARRTSLAVVEYYLGSVYALDENYANARKAYEKALTMNGKFFEAHAGLARVSAQEGKFDEALGSFDKALGLYSQYDEALSGKAEVLVRLGKFEAAADLYGELASLDPSLPYAKYKEYLDRHIQGPGWDKTFVRESANYIVKTGVSQELADLVSQNAEHVRKLYGEYFLDVPRVGRKYDITVYRNAEEYRANGGPLTAGGHYSPYTRTLYIFQYKKQSDLLLVLYHEGSHQYLHEYMEYIPQWFNEGLGDFFGGAWISPNGKKAIIDPSAWRIDGIKDVLRIKGLCPPTAELMNMSRAEMYGEKAGIHYAQAWAIVYYCLNGGQEKYKQPLVKYFLALRKGLSIREAFQATFGKIDMNRFDRDLHNFIDKLPSAKETEAERAKRS
ncbi:MAG: tetratricopeptide repeat protein [Planctomycetota bacterium]